MTPKALLEECSTAGVSVHVINGVLKLRGAADVVQAVADRVRPHKETLLAHLSATAPVGLVAEFMEIDGMSRKDAEALAAVSVQPRAASEWLTMIAELDRLIECYCDGRRLTREARLHIMAARTKQSLASIPAALEWFRRELVASE